MTRLEKKSFFSFLSLYLGSSILFILLSGYWYYNAQKNSIENTIYYKLQHIADSISKQIINAQMKNSILKLPKMDDGYEYLLVPIDEHKTFQSNYYEKNGYKILVSSSPQEHLAIEYVVIKTDEYDKKLTILKRDIFFVMFVVFLAIVFISWVLSKFFMRPLHQKVQEIESFIQDISHELNTPITALSMSASRAIKKGVYDEKILRNISISTKQLYSIYQSLTYLNFDEVKQKVNIVKLKPILQRAIEYYSELSEAKNIDIEVNLDESKLYAIDIKMELLFSNLISNAIKYSMPNTKITIILKDGYFSIEDEGVGIEKSKIDNIFELYTRGSNIAGGFGVGLSVVKQICDEFSIDIKVNSTYGIGTKFELSWQL